MQVHIDTPYLPIDEYARRTGQTPRAVLEQAKKGDLPVKPRKTENDKYFINNALLIKRALEQKH